MLNTLNSQRSFEQIKLDRSIIEYNCKYIKKFWLKLFQIWDSFGTSVDRLLMDPEDGNQNQSISYCELDPNKSHGGSNIWLELSPRFVARQDFMLFRI